MNILKNRTVLGTICIIISLVVCFIIAPYFNAAASSTVDVVQVKRNIKIGQQITENDIEVVKVGYQKFKNVYQKTDEVIGKYAVYELFDGEFLLQNKTSPKPANENVYLYGLTGEKQVISITIQSYAGGLSGKLMSGDIVSIIAPDYMGSGETIIPEELQFVEVIAVTDNSGFDVNETGFTNNRTELEPDGNEKKKLPSTVTVLVRTEQARLLAQLEESGVLHVSLIYRGEASKNKEFINAQDKILDEKYPKENQDDDEILTDITEITTSESESGIDINTLFSLFKTESEGENE